MTREIFERSMLWVNFFVKRGTQGELNLAGIGESTMHPEFLDFARLARAVMGTGRIVLATNGLICSEEIAKELAALKIGVWVSLHRPEKAALAVQIYRKHGILIGTSSDPSLNANDWAGQVKWIDSGNKFPCPWLSSGWVMAMSDGRLTTCCLDAQGIGVVGHVNDPLGSVETKPYELCKKCYQVITEPGWNQKEGIAR